MFVKATRGLGTGAGRWDYPPVYIALDKITNVYRSTGADETCVRIVGGETVPITETPEEFIELVKGVL